jgi:hypothetical protein
MSSWGFLMTQVGEKFQGCLEMCWSIRNLKYLGKMKCFLVGEEAKKQLMHKTLNLFHHFLIAVDNDCCRQWLENAVDND